MSYWFYVGYVQGTDVFKIGFSNNPRERKHTAWYDAPKEVIAYLEDVLGFKTGEGWRSSKEWKEVRKLYHYVILEECETKEEALALETAYRDNIKSRLVRFTTGKAWGDWFRLERLS